MIDKKYLVIGFITFVLLSGIIQNTNASQGPLIIKNSTSIITNRTATISWETNMPSDSTVLYGTTPGHYLLSAHSDNQTMYHNITLTNLSSDTNYYFVINSTNDLYSAQSPERSFWTTYDNLIGFNATNIEIRQLTHNDENASFPIRLNNNIYYSSNVYGDMDIWSMNEDGTNKTRITNLSGDEYPYFISTSWSWENGYIHKMVYISKISGKSNVHVIDIDGTNDTGLTDDNYENLDPALAYLPAPRIFEIYPSGNIDNNMPIINASYYSRYGVNKVNISVDNIDVTRFANITSHNINYVPIVPLDTGKHNFTVRVETYQDTYSSRYMNFDITYIYNMQPRRIWYNTTRISANISVGYGNISSISMTLDETNVTQNMTIYPSYVEYIPINPLIDGPHNVSIKVTSTENFSDIRNWTFCIRSYDSCPYISDYEGGSYIIGNASKILFTSNRLGSFDLWAMNIDGSNPRQITHDTYNETSPIFIDSRVIYVSDSSGNKDILSMEFNGSDNKRLTELALEENIPTHNYIGGILFTTGNNTVSNLNAMNVDGSNRIKLTNSLTSIIKPSVFNPDHGILYQSTDKEKSAIHIMNFDEIGPKVKYWKLKEGYYLQVLAADQKAIPVQAWLNIKKNGISKDDRVVVLNQSFSMEDGRQTILTGFFNRTSGDDNYFGVELTNVTQYSYIDGEPIISNMTKILVNKIMLVTTATTPIPTPTTRENNGGGSSGSSGGGVATSEPYDNIFKYQKIDGNIMANKSSAYLFTVPELSVYQIDIVGKENENDVSIRIESLRNTSKLVNTSAPGIIYKNINIWIGSKRIYNILVKFKVNNSWISNNGLYVVQLFGWDKDRWKELDTKIVSKDDMYSYFESDITGLSTFAISGQKNIRAINTPIIETNGPIETDEPINTQTKPIKSPGFEIIFGMIALLVICTYRRR